MLAGIYASFVEEACILSTLDRLYLDWRCNEFVLSFDITAKLFCFPKKKLFKVAIESYIIFIWLHKIISWRFCLEQQPCYGNGWWFRTNVAEDHKSCKGRTRWYLKWFCFLTWWRSTLMILSHVMQLKLGAALP